MRKDKKFRLIKLFPGLDSRFKIGDIFEYNCSRKCYGCGIHIQTNWDLDYFNSFPEFFEEVIEKKVLIKTEDGVDVFDNSEVYWVRLVGKIEYLYSSAFCELHLQLDFENKFKIFSTKELAKAYVKTKEVLFTTKDGVNIKEGDIWYSVYPPSYNKNDKWKIIKWTPELIKRNRPTLAPTFTGVFRFSSQLLAEEYFKSQAVLLTTEDGVDLKKGDEFWHIDPYWDVMRGILNGNEFIPLKGYKHFSSQNFANEYVRLNKPMYSLQDILDAKAKDARDFRIIYVDLSLL